MAEPGKRRKRPGTETREHVLEVAHELFYWQGIRATGVDEVARAAEVAPVTIYRQFDSKDDLVAAYVERAARLFREWFDAAAGSSEDGRERILAVFDELTVQTRPERCRGCPFLMAMSEFPDPDLAAHEHAVELKSWVRRRFGELAGELTEASHSEEGATQLADRLTLIMEGVYASVQALGQDGPAREARNLVAQLIAPD